MIFKELKLPDVGEDVAEGELVTQHVAPSDKVTEDQVFVEVETDRAPIDVPSPLNGTVRELLAEEGKVVPVDDVVITIQEGDDDEGAAEATDADAETAGSESTKGDDGASDDESGPGGHVLAPPSIRRLAHELGVDLDAIDGSGPSGRATEGGIRVAADDNDDEDNEPSGPRTIQTNRKPATAKRNEGTSAPTSSSAPTESTDREQTLAAPATRALTKEEGVDIDAVLATEIRDDETFASPEAVQECAQAQRGAQTADAEAVSTEADAGTTTAEATADAANEPVPPEAGPGTGERVPYKDVHKAIGDQMQRSEYTAPYVTHHDEVDVTELVELREQLKPVAEEHSSQLTYTPFVMKAIIAALKGFSYFNSWLDEENEGIVLYDEYSIGVVTAIDAGLFVPVVHDADHKGMPELADEMNEEVEKARSCKIAPEEIRGGTFTIANVDGIGGEYVTPIINYPEATILTLGVTKEKPRAIDGKVTPRNVLALSLSFDHRVVDDAQDARFTNRVKELLGDSKLLVLE